MLMSMFIDIRSEGSIRIGSKSAPIDIPTHGSIMNGLASGSDCPPDRTKSSYPDMGVDVMNPLTICPGVGSGERTVGRCGIEFEGDWSKNGGVAWDSGS
jgi:hypothetical protein